jgi:hypothetical protein
MKVHNELLSTALVAGFAMFLGVALMYGMRAIG